MVLYETTVMLNGSSGLLYETFGSLYGSSGLLYDGSVILYEGSVILYDGSVVLYRDSVMLYGGSVMLYNCSVMLYGGSVMLYGTSVLTNYSVGKPSEAVVECFEQSVFQTVKLLIGAYSFRCVAGKGFSSQMGKMVLIAFCFSSVVSILFIAKKSALLELNFINM